MIPARVKKVVVTGHAKSRLLQRARLLLREHELEDLSYFIEQQFRKSYVDIRIENCPAWKNQLCLKHGPDAFKSQTKDFIFQGVHDKDFGVVVIKTVLLRRSLPKDYKPI